MKKDRHLLEEDFKLILSEINLNKKALSNIVEKLSERNISQTIIYGGIPVETVSLDVIYNIIDIIYSEIKKMNPEDYFTDIEIDLYKKIDNKQKAKTYPLEFKNVTRINNDQFGLYLSAQEIVELYRSDLIIYNFDTQRDKKVTKKNNFIIESVNINKNSIAEMKEQILKGSFITNHITINLLQDGNEDFIFNDKENTLTILSGQLNILDGFHRSLAMIYALAENPNVDYISGVYITNFDIDKAKRYIIQEDKKNKISKKYIMSLDTSNFSNQIITKINESSISDLKGKVVIESANIYRGAGLVNWETLRTSIEQNFIVKTRKDVMDISEFLINGLNIIIGEYPDMFLENVEKGKAKYVYAYNNMFIAYITMLGKLYKTEDWESKLKEKINEIDFSIKNELLIDLGITLKTYETKPIVVRNIINYFKEV